ncbi:hypothetical protein EGW08_006026, partial [Elysia chlorotica]
MSENQEGSGEKDSTKGHVSHHDDTLEKPSVNETASESSLLDFGGARYEPDGHQVRETTSSVVSQSPAHNDISFMPDISGSGAGVDQQVFSSNDEPETKHDLQLHETLSGLDIKSSRPESLSLQPENESGEQGTLLADHPGTKAGVSGENAFKKSEAVNIPRHRQQEDKEYSSMSQNLPQGTITRKGNLIEFVASDLQEKIKQSSPLSQPDALSSGSRRSSIKSYASASSSTSFATSSGMSQSPSSACQQSPDDIPPIDAAALIELENHAARVADSVDLMMGNIRNNLHKMSAITIGCQEAYKRSVDITCDSVDGGIKVVIIIILYHFFLIVVLS